MRYCNIFIFCDVCVYALMCECEKYTSLKKIILCLCVYVHVYTDYCDMKLEEKPVNTFGLPSLNRIALLMSQEWYN